MPFAAPWQASYNPGLAYLRWTPPPEDVFGSVYVQGRVYNHLLEGIASYHFDSLEECYISYSSSPSDWTLDNGLQPPAKKNFVGATYNHDSRVFRGTVEWEVPFGGDASWDYEMVFSEDFTHIVCGQIRAKGVDGRETDTTHFYPPSAGRLLDGMTYVQRPGVLSPTSCPAAAAAAGSRRDE